MTTLARDNDLVQFLPLANITYKILNKHPDLSIQNGEGETALHLIDDWTLFSYAIKHGRNVSLSIKNQKGETALHSIFRKYIPTRKWMITEANISGADMNIPNSDGDTPLHILLENIKPKSDKSEISPVIKLLISLGANPDLKNGAGMSARDLEQKQGMGNVFQ